MFLRRSSGPHLRLWDAQTDVVKNDAWRGVISAEDFGLTDQTSLVCVRYLVDDVEAAIAFYSAHLGFEVLSSYTPAFADMARGNLRLLLSGPKSSAGRPMPDGAQPGPGGWNRIHLIVEDIESEVARLRDAGVEFRNDILEGPGGKQVLLRDPAGNVVELFQPDESWGKR